MPTITGPETTHTIHRRFSYEGPRTMRVVTDGLAVDVTVGHEDHDGRWVTRVDFLIDDGVTGLPDPAGRVWVRDGARFVRLHEGETSLPGLRPEHPPLTLDTASLLARLADMRDRRVRFIPDGVDDVVTGTLRHIVKPDSDGFLTAADDVRDGRVRITLDLGTDVYLPVPAVLARMAGGEFAIADQ